MELRGGPRFRPGPLAVGLRASPLPLGDSVTHETVPPSQWVLAGSQE